MNPFHGATPNTKVAFAAAFAPLLQGDAAEARRVGAPYVPHEGGPPGVTLGGKGTNRRFLSQAASGKRSQKVNQAQRCYSRMLYVASVELIFSF